MLDITPDRTEAPSLSSEAFALDLAPRLDGTEIRDPAILTELFRYATIPSPHCVALRHALQKALLAETLRRACAHTAFYRDDSRYAAWRPEPGAAAPSLGDLPVIDREAVVERHADFVADNLSLRSICHTSGTTGTPLDVYKSFEEVEFLSAYFNALQRPVQRSLPAKPLSLSFPNFYHGVPVPLPGLGMGFVSGVTDDTLIADARRVLSNRYRFPGHDERISLLNGLTHHVTFFTSYLLEQGIDPRDFGLNAVSITGGYMAPHWMAFLGESWGCRINNRFTLTEAIGGASREPFSQVFRLDPHIIGEVLDLDSNAPVEDGIGLLALTSLDPFIQMFPLIRYTTGDLVRRLPDPGDVRFEFLGKAKNCLSLDRDGRREWLLFSTGLNGIVSALPDVRVFDWFSNVTVVHDRSVGSLPILAVESDATEAGLRITLSLELRYAPHIHRDRIDELRRIITEGLRREPGTTLAARIDDGSVDLDIRFFSPGQLNKPIVIKI